MPRLPKFLRRKPPNPEGRMSVLEHLRELRRRLIIILIIVGIGAVAGWYFYPHILSFLDKPYCAVPTKNRFVSASDPKACSLIYTGVLDGFTARLKISVIAGAVLTGPLWLYQIWGFVTPGLHKNERRYTIAFIISSSLLFIAGMVLAFLMLYKGLAIMLTMSGHGTTALLTINEYLSFVMMMLLVFGSAFELPLLIVLMNLAGVLPAKLLKRTQRVAIFLIFVFAAVATPTGDPFTMCAMAVPMVLLYEVAVLVAHIHDRRKAERKELERKQSRADDAIPSRIDPIPRALSEDWTETT